MSKNHFVYCLLVICGALLPSSHAQTVAVIPANEAAAHVNAWATVEGVVAKVFTSKSGNTFPNIGAKYPNQTFTGWIPNASPVSKSPLLTGIEGKHVKVTGRIEIYKRKPEIRINAPEQTGLCLICPFVVLARSSMTRRDIVERFPLIDSGIEKLSRQ